MGYHTIITRYVAKWGIAQMCPCETKYQGGAIAPFGGSAALSEKVSRDMGCRSDSIAVSRDTGPLMTVGFLYGAGAETLIFATGTSGKKSENFHVPAEKPKSAVDTQKTKKNRCLGIRCWDPNLSGGYQNCGLGIHPWEIFRNRSGKNSEIFSKV